jgi:hypothetical protein
MLKTAAGVSDPSAHGPSSDEIRRQLHAILISPAFLGSKRSQQFLEYVCDKSLRGEGSSLKERTIAVEVFGRPPESDLGEDTIVRVSAREVRKRLAQYYLTPDGAAAEVRIDLPSGAYAPDFHFATPVREPDPIVAPRPRRSRYAWWPAAVVLALAAVGSVLWFTAPNANVKAFHRFWEPVLASRDPLLLAMAHPIVYHPSNRALKLSEENMPPQEPPGQRAVQVPPEKLNGNDLVPVFNQYVGFGDMVVATEISTMLAARGKPFRLRLASTVEFADLRKEPALLIGAITNRWTMELQQSWRFRFQYTPGTKVVIADSAAGNESRQWSVPAKDDGSTPNDYLMVCRIHSSQTGSVILVAAGLKQFGTEAAGRLLTDPDQLGPILRKLPAGWESQNLQLVLHARVIGNTPAQPEIVATQVW